MYKKSIVKIKNRWLQLKLLYIVKYTPKTYVFGVYLVGYHFRPTKMAITYEIATPLHQPNIYAYYYSLNRFL